MRRSFVITRTTTSRLNTEVNALTVTRLRWSERILTSLGAKTTSLAKSHGRSPNPQRQRSHSPKPTQRKSDYGHFTARLPPPLPHPPFPACSSPFCEPSCSPPDASSSPAPSIPHAASGAPPQSSHCALSVSFVPRGGAIERNAHRLAPPEPLGTIVDPLRTLLLCSKRHIHPNARLLEYNTDDFPLGTLKRPTREREKGRQRTGSDPSAVPPSESGGFLESLRVDLGGSGSEELGWGRGGAFQRLEFEVEAGEEGEGGCGRGGVSAGTRRERERTYWILEA